MLWRLTSAAHYLIVMVFEFWLILSVDDHFDEADSMLCISLFLFVMMIKFIFARYLSVDLDECNAFSIVFCFFFIVDDDDEIYIFEWSHSIDNDLKKMMY